MTWITTWKKVYKDKLLIVKFKDTGTGKEDWTYFLLKDCDSEKDCQVYSEEDMKLFAQSSKQLPENL